MIPLGSLIHLLGICPARTASEGLAVYFKYMVREKNFPSIEQAIHHVTELSAKRFKLRDSGVLNSGAYADIVVMNIDRVKDTETPLNPYVYPEGIMHVMVNRSDVVDNMTHTGMTL